MSAQIRIGGEVFDGRDVIEEVSDLEALSEEVELDEDDVRRLAALQELNEWGEENVTDWQYGETLIREDYFTEYARELAEDIGAFHIPADRFAYHPQQDRDLSTEWPFRHIDWEAAAEELKQDYTEVEFQGSKYYVRAG